MRDPKIVILAGGISSRMKRAASLTENVDHKLLLEAKERSKTMLSVGHDSRPFLDYVLYNIREAGYTEVVIVVGEKDLTIREYYETKGGARQFKELTISYAVQKIPLGRNKPLGTADALLVALISKPAWEGQTFEVCNSDNLYSVRALRLLLEDKHENAMIDYDRSALLFDQARIEAFSVIRSDRKGYLLDIIEKPSTEEIERAKEVSRRVGVSMNIFKFSYDMILPFLKETPLHPIRHEKELPLAVNMMIEKRPGSVFTIPLSEHVIDLTNPMDIKQVQEYLRREFSKFST